MAKNILIDRQVSLSRNSDGDEEPVVDVRLALPDPGTLTIWGLMDVHYDDRRSHHKLLSQNIARILADPYARVVIGGDFNDCILWGDPRFVVGGLREYVYDLHTKKGIERSEYSKGATDALVDYNVACLKPLADAGKIDLYISGNHEETYYKRHNVDVAIKTAGKLGVPYASFYSALRYFIEHHDHRAQTDGFVHHGFGGSAPVTKGMIMLQRLQMEKHFDWYMTGHLHAKTMSEQPVLEARGSFGHGRLDEIPTAAILCGTYMRTYAGRKEASWAATKGHSPAPLGAGRMYLDVAPGQHKLEIIPRVN